MISLSAKDCEFPLRHVAIIMDGNRRWARERGLSAISGHRQGVENVREVLQCCRDHGVDILSLFAFSSENWSRPQSEVNALMALFVKYIQNEVSKLSDEGVRLRVIGARERFSNAVCRQIEHAESLTREGDFDLVLAVDYGGRWDITNAARALAEKVRDGELSVDQIDEGAVSDMLCTADFPAPDLCIRTAGEQRISNFLLWQMAYTELYFADCYWPDFGREEFFAAAEAYSKRQRRFGVDKGMQAASRRGRA